MIYLLTCILFCIMLIAYFAAERDIIEPAVAVPTSFFFCTAMCALYIDVWNMPMHFNTAMTIIIMVILFECGVWVAVRNLPLDRIKARTDFVFTEYRLHFVWSVLLVGIALVCAYMNYNELFTISRAYTQSTNIGEMIHRTVLHLQLEEVKFSRWYGYRLHLIYGIAYACLFAFLRNLVFLGPLRLRNLCFLMPVVASIPTFVFATTRQHIVYMSIFAMVTTVFSYEQKHHFDEKENIKLLLLGMVGFVCVLGGFFALGMLSGKIREISDFTRVLAHYVGTNIAALDVFINHGMEIVETPYPATTTLGVIYKKLEAIGFDVPKVKDVFYYFVYFDGISTNVFTALRKYIQDFGYTGCGMIMFILGAGYTMAYRMLKYWRYKEGALLLYAAMAFPLFLMAREERFLTEFIGTTFLYRALCVYIVYKFLRYQIAVKEREE